MGRYWYLWAISAFLYILVLILLIGSLDCPLSPDPCQ